MKTDNLGNPLNADGSLKVDVVSSVDELTDEDFMSPTRNVQLPALSQIVADAIGSGKKPVVIKKNIFTKNRKAHRHILEQVSIRATIALFSAPSMERARKGSRSTSRRRWRKITRTTE